MGKTTSIIIGVLLMTIALFLFCADNMWCAGIGTGCLFFSYLCFRDTDEEPNK